MAKEVKHSISAINVRIHPHNKKLYSQLIKEAYRIQTEGQITTKIHGDRHGIISKPRPRSVGGEIIGYNGTLATFVKINFDAEWFNLEKGVVAEDDELTEMEGIGKYAPNHKSFYFYFDIKKHMLYFETFAKGNSLSPKLMKKFLEGLLSRKGIFRKFGEVDLTVVPTEDTIKKIFAMPVLKKLELTIRRPNPDDHQEDEKNFLDAMDNQNLSAIEQSYKAKPGTSIKPNKKTKILAKIAEINGVVEAYGRDGQNKPTYESTTKYPKRVTNYYDPDVTSPALFFHQQIKAFK